MKFKFALLAGLALASVSPTATAQEPAADPYATVMKRDFGTAIPEMTAIERDIEAAKPDQYSAFEDHLLAILDAPDATKPGKQFALQMLRLVGSSKCVPSVTKLLIDEQLSHMARYVLLPMRTPPVDEAFRQALGQTQGAVQIGIINSLGDRRDTVSLKPIAALVASPDELTGRSALNAIGKIGGAPAAGALDRVKPTDPLKGAWALAYLRTAEGLTATGDKQHADKMLRTLLKGDYPLAVRAGALGAYAQMDKEKSVPMILQALGSPDGIMKRAAVSSVIMVPGHAATVAFAQQLPRVPADSKPMLLSALAARGDAVGLTASVDKLATDPDPTIRLAAVQALGQLGGAVSVPTLAVALRDPAIHDDAIKSLVALHGAGVEQAIVLSADGGDSATRAAIMGILVKRNEVSALPSIRKATMDTDPQVRQAGLDALSELGTEQDLQRLSAAIRTARDDSEREAIGNAMSAIGLRIPDESARTAPILQAYAGATPEVKARLITVLSALGGDRALHGVVAALADDGPVRKAAIRGLAAWSTTAPMGDLRTAAKDDKDSNNRIVALQGYIRMIPNSGQKQETQVQAYQDAIELAERPDEKRQALGGLANVSSTGALKVAASYLDNADVKQEAFLAYEKIAESLAGSQPDVAKDALKRVADTATDNDLRNKAKAALDKIK